MKKSHIVLKGLSIAWGRQKTGRCSIGVPVLTNSLVFVDFSYCLESSALEQSWIFLQPHGVLPAPSNTSHNLRRLRKEPLHHRLQTCSAVFLWAALVWGTLSLGKQQQPPARTDQVWQSPSGDQTGNKLCNCRRDEHILKFNLTCWVILLGVVRY